MTGAILAQRLLKRISLRVSIARGFPNRYDWRERRAYLSPEIFDGTDAAALAIAAHEISHARQHSKMGAFWLVVFSRVEPFNLWLERRTWNQAMILLVEELRPSLCELTEMCAVRRACLRTDTTRALAYCGGALAVLAVAFALRASG